MVHRNEQHEQHRHSSYYPENKNYKRDHRRSLVSFTMANKNHASTGNNNHTPVNDNDRSVEDRLAAAATTSLSSTSCLGKSGADHEDNAAATAAAAAAADVDVDVDNGNNVRWSKLLRHDGTPSKVLLYPEEGWARTATNAYWLLSIPWWNRNRCKVVEVAGTRRSTTQAKLIDAGQGTVYVVGSFKGSADPEPEFKLALTSRISKNDVNLGYAMTGTLERGYGDDLQTTHFAVLRRCEWNN